MFPGTGALFVRITAYGDDIYFNVVAMSTAAENRPREVLLCVFFYDKTQLLPFHEEVEQVARVRLPLCVKIDIIALESDITYVAVLAIYKDSRPRTVC